jgi:hypothetical protein
MKGEFSIERVGGGVLVRLERAGVDPGHREGLPALHSIHDLFGPHPQVSLCDFGLFAGTQAKATSAYPLANLMQKALSLFEKGPLALVAGAGFEPATSGL